MRAIAFIDNSSIFISSNQSGYNYDLGKLVSAIADGHQVCDRRIYGSMIPNAHLGGLDTVTLQREMNRQQFFKSKKREGYTVVVLERVLRGATKLRCRSCEAKFIAETVSCPECGTMVPIPRQKQFFAEKEVDVAIASDMVLLAAKNAFDVALLFSGDLDFRYAVDLLAVMGKTVVNAAFRWGHSGQLRQRCLELGGRYVVLDRLCGARGNAAVWRRTSNPT